MSDIKDVSTEVEENDMIKKLKEMFDKSGMGSEESAEEVVEPQPPLEAAIERALFSLNEIYIFAEYGRTAEAAREAKEALDVITALKQKWDEQNAIMEALSNPESRNRQNSFDHDNEDELYK